MSLEFFGKAERLVDGVAKRVVSVPG
jgi:hypothetical protein